MRQGFLTRSYSLPNYITLNEAPLNLSRAARIMVIGCSGGGKSTLSRKLATACNLDYLSIDRDVRWMPGWVSRDKKEQRRLLGELVLRDRWVMDGTGASTFDIRLPRTDLVVWVRVPRRVALAGLAIRVINHFGTTRPEMADGCPEQFPDWTFLSYIWNFEKRSAPAIINNLDRYAPDVPVLVLKSRYEINRLSDEF